jgi:5-(carboxyamino)imidazole ribonucleotide synthase
MNIGILGGGQLGRMIAMAGARLGCRFRVLDPADDAPAARFAEHVCAPYDDPRAVERFADGLDVVTYEFENIPPETLVQIHQTGIPVFPPFTALVLGQDRISEKNYFKELGIATPAYVPVNSPEGILEGVRRDVGLPAVLKSRNYGYDGKGQRVVFSEEDVEAAWQEVKRHSILEAAVPFDRELSVIAVRSRDGQVLFYPLVENRHKGGILRKSIAPAPNASEELQSAAREIAMKILNALDYVGVLAVELFEVDGRLLANEMAPRVHNSGHWTIEGAQTSQFENHLRAVAGLPLGSTELVAPCVMVNLIGSIPPVDEILAVAGASLHLYDKAPKPGRKLGHVTIRGAPGVDLEESAERIEALLK